MGLVETLKKAYVYASTKDVKEVFSEGTGVLISSLENAGAKIDNGLEKTFPYASHTNVEDALKDSGACLGNAYNRAYNRTISSLENAGAWVEQNLQKVALAGLIAGTAFAYSAPKIAYAEAPKPPTAVKSHTYYQMDLKGKSLEEQLDKIWLGRILRGENATELSALSSEIRKIQEKSYPSERYGDKSVFFSEKYAEKNLINPYSLIEWTSTLYSNGTRKYHKQEPNFISQIPEAISQAISQTQEASEKNTDSSKNYPNYLDVKRKMANTSKKAAEFGLGAMGVLGLGLLGVYGYKTIGQRRKSGLSKNSKGDDGGNGNGGNEPKKIIEIKPKKPTYAPSESLEAELKGNRSLFKSLAENINYFLAKKNDDKNSGNGEDKKQAVILENGSFSYKNQIITPADEEKMNALQKLGEAFAHMFGGSSKAKYAEVKPVAVDYPMPPAYTPTKNPNPRNTTSGDRLERLVEDYKKVVVLDAGSFFYLPEQDGGGPDDDNKGPKGGMKPQKQASIDDTVDNVPGKTTSQENNGSSAGLMYDRFYARTARKDGYLDTIAEELIQKYNCSDAEGKRLYKVKDIADEFRMSKGQLYRILHNNEDRVNKRSPRNLNKEKAEKNEGKIVSFAEAKRRKQEKNKAHALNEDRDYFLGRR